MDKKNDVFLATTALEEFWDTTKPVVFLGDWCKRYSRRSVWEKVHKETLESPWKERSAVEVAYKYTNEVYEKMLTILSEYLNELHRENHSLRYWRIVLGIWLSYYIAAMYDKYVLLKKALEKFPGLNTIVLSEKSFVTPQNTRDYIDLIINDPYNLQMCAKIISFFGKKFPEKVYTYNKVNKKQSLKTKVKLSIGKLAKLVLDLNNAKIVMQNSYFRRAIEHRFVLATQGKISVTRNTDNTDSIEFIIDPALRSSLVLKYNENAQHDEFLHLLLMLLPFDLPVCYIEGYMKVREISEKEYKKTPEAIFSSNSWYADEVFKQWAAGCSEKGTLLLCSQHGGMYGINDYMIHEDFELSIADHYYSWGWDRTDYKNKIITMPANKLIKKNNTLFQKKEGTIFYSLNIWPRYLFRFMPVLPNYTNNYLDWQLQFVSFLSDENKFRLSVRLYQTEYGWDCKQRWADAFPNIDIEDWSIPFSKSLGKCCLFICDNSSTTFLEALSQNKPTILFWDPEVNYIKKDASPYLEKLYELGILHYSPEAAAKQVNKIYGNLEVWWNEPKRQTAVKEFSNRFAKSSPAAFKEWLIEFRRVTGKNL